MQHKYRAIGRGSLEVDSYILLRAGRNKKFEWEYARMLQNRAKGIEGQNPRIPAKLFEPNRNLIRSTLDRIWQRSGWKTQICHQQVKPHSSRYCHLHWNFSVFLNTGMPLDFEVCEWHFTTRSGMCDTKMTMWDNPKLIQIAAPLSTKKTKDFYTSWHCQAKDRVYYIIGNI